MPSASSVSDPVAMSGGYGLVADAVLVAHLAFVVFAVFGGFLALRWHWWTMIHLPAACWVVLVEWMNWPCPLTPIEQHFRVLAGQDGYSGDFVSHYLMPIIYPGNLTRSTQVLLGALALMINAIAYASVCYRIRNRHAEDA